MKIELPKFVSKGWGWESWLANNELYCGKILYVHRGKICSYHFHRVKDETFFILEGKIHLFYSDEDDITKAKEVILVPGDSFRIMPLIRHRFLGIENSRIIEISTHHDEEDSYRLVDGDSQKGG